MRRGILEKFAGPPDTGVFSASVQNTLYIAGKAAIARIPQVNTILLGMLSFHETGDFVVHV